MRVFHKPPPEFGSKDRHVLSIRMCRETSDSFTKLPREHLHSEKTEKTAILSFLTSTLYRKRSLPLSLALSHTCDQDANQIFTVGLSMSAMNATQSIVKEEPTFSIHKADTVELKPKLDLFGTLVDAAVNKAHTPRTTMIQDSSQEHGLVISPDAQPAVSCSSSKTPSKKETASSVTLAFDQELNIQSPVQKGHLKVQVPKTTISGPKSSTGASVGRRCKMPMCTSMARSRGLWYVRFGI